MLDRIGVGTVYADISALGPSSGSSVLVTTSGITVQPGIFYGVKTSLGAISLTLPSRAAQSPPAYLEIGDIDNDAGTNNITVHAAVGDLISDHGVTSSSYVIVISNIIVRFIANTTYWTAIPFGS